MKKTFLIISFTLLLLALGGCSEDKPDKQLNLLEYPPQITQEDKFNVKCEYLTEDPGDEDVKVVMTIREADTNDGLLTEERNLTNKSQVVSFTNLDLSEIKPENLSYNLYFELKLIINGKFKQKVTTESNQTRVANWHTSIYTTYFNPIGKNTWGYPLDEENPYYFALPYRSFYQKIANDGIDDPVRRDFYGITGVKNRWIEIKYNGNTAYAQWEDVGPWNYYDPHYVFSTDDQRPYAEMGVDMGWSSEGYRETNKAGLDVSPEVMKYLTGGELLGKIQVDWRFVTSEQVPAGPWKESISTQETNPQILNLETRTLRNRE